MTENDATLVLNGSAQRHTEMTVLQLVRRESGPSHGPDSTTTAGACGVAVAVNGEVIPRSAWARTELVPGDRVELLSAVQGG